MHSCTAGLLPNSCSTCAVVSATIGISVNVVKGIQDSCNFFLSLFLYFCSVLVTFLDFFESVYGLCLFPSTC